MNSDVYGTVLNIAEFILCIKSLRVNFGKECWNLAQEMIFSQFVKSSHV